MARDDVHHGDAGTSIALPLADAAAVVDLRIMATSDLHMQLLAYDYQRRRALPPATAGLEGLAPLIAEARAGAVNALLFDNGDLLQGNLLGDHAAGRTCAAAHPAIAGLNALGCDAATLGNHDFSYGARVLGRALAGARYPVVVANARDPGLRGVPPWAMLARRMTDRAGVAHGLRIGVIGFVPPQTAAWEATAVPRLRTEDILSAAAREVPRMRAAGADLVVALVHGGVEDGPSGLHPENAAGALALMAGIDAVVAGHVHDVLPPEGTVIHHREGAAPMVMPGFAGSHLGVIDLTLVPHAGGGWRVAGATSRCLATGQGTTPPAEIGPEAAAVRRAVLPAHAAALRAARGRVGRSSMPMGSYFALLGQDAGLKLVAMAKRWHVGRALAGGPFAGWPVIAAVSPFRAGGRGGPGHYTDLPAGPLRRSDIADLYAFSNRPAAVAVTGADLADWLERAAGAFHHMRPGGADQPLLDESFPSYDFDLLDGLSWRIDLSQPARYTPDGALRDPAARRIAGLTHRGAPVRPDARFILATNSYRLAGGGLYRALTEGRPVVHAGTRPMPEVIAAYLRRRRRVAPDDRPAFAFAPVPGASAEFPTGPAAEAHLPRLHWPVQVLRRCEQGFLRLRLPLDGA